MRWARVGRGWPGGPEREGRDCGSAAVHTAIHQPTYLVSFHRPGGPRARHRHTGARGDSAAGGWPADDHKVSKRRIIQSTYRGVHTGTKARRSNTHPTPSHRTLQTGQGSPPKASRRRSADERSCCAPMERRKRHAMRSKAQAKTCEQQHTQKKQSVKQLSKWLRPIVPHDGRRHKSQASPSPRLSDRRSTPRSAEP